MYSISSSQSPHYVKAKAMWDGLCNRSVVPPTNLYSRPLNLGGFSAHPDELEGSRNDARTSAARLMRVRQAPWCFLSGHTPLNFWASLTEIWLLRGHAGWTLSGETACGQRWQLHLSQPPAHGAPPSRRQPSESRPSVIPAPATNWLQTWEHLGRSAPLAQW